MSAARLVHTDKVDDLDLIIALAEKMQGRRSLEDLLQLIAEHGAGLLGVERVAIRLLDPGRQRLLAVARAGQPLHVQPVEFQVGDGLIGWIVQHNQPLRVANAESDPRFASRPGMVAAMGAFVGVPIRAGAHCIGVLSALNPSRPFEARDQRLLELLAAMSGPHLEIVRLSRLSRVDPLTGSLNRRGLDEMFPEASGRSHGGLIVPLSVVMLDVDRFKLINDEHGHAAGDIVLRHVATVAAQVLRSGDAVIRYGGEEFLLVLPEANVEQAAKVAERVRAAIGGQAVPVGQIGVPVTVSLGVAERRPAELREEVIARADAALYRAKQAGRDRVVIEV